MCYRVWVLLLQFPPLDAILDPAEAGTAKALFPLTSVSVTSALEGDEPTTLSYGCPLPTQSPAAQPWTCTQVGEASFRLDNPGKGQSQMSEHWKQTPLCCCLGNLAHTTSHHLVVCGAH